MEIELSQFLPGKSYKVKRYLGAGSWKIAFSGSAPGIMEDVALLCYHNHDTKAAALDISRLIQLDRSHIFSEYLPEFHNLFSGDDRRLWLVEELLAQPLSSIAPMMDVGRFVRIARDLCRAVTCIHDQGLVHRDIKMENCGIDSHDRAKIFDLGSLVSDPGESPCTIFTRPPEVLRLSPENFAFGQKGDVWSLGATLFALRSGNYPFATAADVRSRYIINDMLAKGDLSRQDAEIAKEPLNRAVTERASASNAGKVLIAAVRDKFAGPVANILCEMLSFDPDLRKTGAEYEVMWSELAENLATPGGRGVIGQEAWARVENVLLAFVRGDLALTPKQVEKILQEWRATTGEQPPEVCERLEVLVPKAKALAEERSGIRRTTVYQSILAHQDG